MVITPCFLWRLVSSIVKSQIQVTLSNNKSKRSRTERVNTTASCPNSSPRPRGQTATTCSATQRETGLPESVLCPVRASETQLGFSLSKCVPSSVHEHTTLFRKSVNHPARSSASHGSSQPRRARARIVLTCAFVREERWRSTIVCILI